MIKSVCLTLGPGGIVRPHAGQSIISARPDRVRLPLTPGKSKCCPVATTKRADALEKRPQLAAALELARQTDATIVVAKLDRLTRDVHFGSGLMAPGGARVRCFTRDGHDWAGRFSAIARRIKAA
jgi:hypothetical protein